LNDAFTDFTKAWSQNEKFCSILVIGVARDFNAGAGDG
jgi:hypothetical protein